MELKDLLPLVLGGIGIVIAIWQFWKSHKIEKRSLEISNRSFEIEKQNLELQRQVHQYQVDKDKKEEAKPLLEALDTSRQQKSDGELYCTHIYEKFKHLDFTGLNALLHKPLLLEEIYVGLRAQKALTLEHYHTIAHFKELDKEKIKKEEGDQDFLSLFRDLYRQQKDKKKPSKLAILGHPVDGKTTLLKSEELIDKIEPLKAVILGHPGSGKTTLMKWIALQCACNGSDSFWTDFTPVFISLKDFGRDPEQTYKTKSILPLAEAQLEHEGINPVFLKDLFESSGLIFLLDGLDEVADEHIRREVIDWIQNQNIRKNVLLVTSRFSGLQESRGMRFHSAIPVYTILDFDIADIERFLENWYTKVEIALMPSEKEEDIEAARKKGEERFASLMEIIKREDYKNLRELAVNPLLLTVIALVHRRKAVLPKERHRLYYDALEIMILLWNEGTGRHTMGFSIENCLANLAILAKEMIIKNCRELDLKEIESLLPAEIQNQKRSVFIKEMLLKAGLLYHSEGKYGFLHLTFQEYLAAWYFVHQENQNEILAYRDKDYWTETFKLFVNIGNARVLYNEIMDHLQEKEYWRQMNLWEDCLMGIVAEDVQKEIELKFARKILAILPDIEYEEENEEFIIQLYAHYPLYMRATEFIKEGWQLFDDAKHPFVQSVGSSILNRAGQETRAALIAEIEKRMDDFEKETEQAPQQCLDFMYQNENSFLLLLNGRKNLSDFSRALARLKSKTSFIVYLDLLDFRYLLDLRGHLDLLDLRYLLDLLDLRDLRYLRYLRDLLDLRGHLDLLDLRYFRYLRAPLDLRYLRDQFIQRYQSILEQHQPEIHAWVDHAFEKLRQLPEENILEVFPNTTHEAIEAFKKGS